MRLAEPCPTFRPIQRGEMVAPRQAQLIGAQMPKYGSARVAVA